MTYTSMVLENANLHQGLRRNQDKIRDLQAELRHTKGILSYFILIISGYINNII
jgi:hypothetical protein